MKEAFFYKNTDSTEVQCRLCNHFCHIKNGQVGICKVRKNIDGKLYSLNYGYLAAGGSDPVEKKPLFHFFPGSDAYSIASAGCNFSCGFCQNWHISQADTKKISLSQKVSSKDIVESAYTKNCKSIAYTYTEPTVFFEFAYQTAKLAYAKGLKNIFVTNGFMSREALEKVLPVLDAANVDLKSFSSKFYRDFCNGKLEPVLDNIRLMKENNLWLELTTLIIPGFNDSDEELSKIAGFISSIDVDIPWHISRFFPCYNFDNVEPTDLRIMEKAYKIGKNFGLNYVYPGNCSLPGLSDSYCPKCGKTIISRIGYMIKSNHIQSGKCSYCDNPIAGCFD